ncbi:hypothetical protein RHGRI_022141 [Rhododendron griersonianum]|uniref:GDSL esterase/lipase n=1 Tax=Rhododendron griersonianum TaxID=479676 RepID=A0AAV6JT83_9ERIC|nr:hypothetical protein RHGRI_022141 [Rhododendron griersonianum]
MSPLVSTYIPGSDQARTVFNFTEFFHGRTLYILGDSTVVAHLKMVDHPYGVDRVNVERSFKYGGFLFSTPNSGGLRVLKVIALFINPLATPGFSKADFIPESLTMLGANNELGARNFVINNLAPIGCSPDQRDQSSNSCDYDLNKSIGEFNEELESALRKFKEEYYNATILLADFQKMFVEIESNPLKFGFTVIDKPCCGEWDSSIKRFRCLERSGYYSNRNEYLFFDGTHPTDEANRLFADNCLAGRVCYPIDP